MPTALPDFEKIFRPFRDWATKAGIQKYFYILSPTLSPGQSTQINYYTVPNGKNLYMSDFYIGTNGCTTRVQHIMGYNIWQFDYTIEAATPFHHASLVPYVATTGKVLSVYFWNIDIVPGQPTLTTYSWEEPASEPEKPQSDDPEELYRCGVFDWAQVYPLNDTETLILFTKRKEAKGNLLRIENYGRSNQRKIYGFKMLPEELVEITDTIKNKPQKMIEVLKKYEIKNKK